MVLGEQSKWCAWYRTTLDRSTPCKWRALPRSRPLPAVRATVTPWLRTALYRAWGSNTIGGVGNGEFSDMVLEPVQVFGLAGVVALGSSSYNYDCQVIRADHTLWGWGGNYNGALGNGTTEDSNVPVQVQGLTDVVEVARGVSHTLAVKSDGTLWGWGWNNSGQLADSVLTRSLVPMLIEEGCEWCSVQACPIMPARFRIQVFPDPTTGPVWIKTSVPDLAQFVVLNSHGSVRALRPVHREYSGDRSSGLPAAVYTIVLRGTESSGVGRVVKQ